VAGCSTFPGVSDTYPIPIEDRDTRDPEWQPIELGYGQPPTMRTYEWDPISNGVRVTGPLIAAPLTKRQRREKPVP
jgi:hypothetical protein